MLLRLITEETLRAEILAMRQDVDLAAFAVAVGEGDLMAGTMLAGIPVFLSPLPMPLACHVLIGTMVVEPGLACAELGAE